MNRSLRAKAEADDDSPVSTTVANNQPTTPAAKAASIPTSGTFLITIGRNISEVGPIDQEPSLA